MMNKGVAIKYNDVAPGAKESFVPEATEKAEFVDLQQLQRNNLRFVNFGNPCELYQTALDGSASVLPAALDNENMGLWSVQVSDGVGVFALPIVLTLTSAGQYSSQGITLTFDEYNGIYCTALNMKWYRGAELLYNLDFEPDSAYYFCRQQVENYDKVVITFRRINMPYNRLKLRVIDYGYGTHFYGNELRNVKLIQEMNPLSSEISINTCDFTLDSKSDMEYSFQDNQPLSVYFNGMLRATVFVKDSKRKTKRLWEVQTEDYIGLMEDIPFPGGVYVDKDVAELYNEIFACAKVPYRLSEVFKGIKVSGYIPYTTCREATMQVSFAVGAVIGTANSDVVEVYALSDEVTQIVPLRRIMQGQNFSAEKTTTGVEVMAHQYVAKSVVNDNRISAYNAEESGLGKNILVKFSEPLHDLYCAGSGEIVQSGHNYAIVNAYGLDFRLVGYGYEHTTTLYRKNNPIVLASEIEKIVAVEGATLVSAANVNAVLERCYAWYMKKQQTNLKIREGKNVTGGTRAKYGGVKYGTVKYGGTTPYVVTYETPVNVGDVIECETEYLGNVSGRVIKETFSLNGGIIIKEAELK